MNGSTCSGSESGGSSSEGERKRKDAPATISMSGLAQRMRNCLEAPGRIEAQAPEPQPRRPGALAAALAAAGRPGLQQAQEAVSAAPRARGEGELELALRKAGEVLAKIVSERPWPFDAVSLLNVSLQGCYRPSSAEGMAMITYADAAERVKGDEPGDIRVCVTVCGLSFLGEPASLKKDAKQQAALKAICELIHNAGHCIPEVCSNAAKRRRCGSEGAASGPVAVEAADATAPMLVDDGCSWTTPGAGAFVSQALCASGPLAAVGSYLAGIAPGSHGCGPVGLLNEAMQKHCRPAANSANLPDYTEVAKEGPNGGFTMAVEIYGRRFVGACQPSKRAAKEKAAEAAVEALRMEFGPRPRAAA